MERGWFLKVLEKRTIEKRREDIIIIIKINLIRFDKFNKPYNDEMTMERRWLKVLDGGKESILIIIKINLIRIIEF